jgi:two-component system, response regulator PdtaR
MSSNGKLRILVADDESVIVLSLKSQLKALGYEVVGEASNGEEAVAQARSLQPDLIIIDIKMPNMDGIEAARRITMERPVPIVLLTAWSEQELVDRAAESGIFAYLMKPASDEDLLPAIMLASARFQEFQSLKKGIGELQEALEARQIVEQAKRILMTRRSLSEAEAFRRLQRQSQDTNKKLIDVAKAIVTADSLI